MHRLMLLLGALAVPALATAQGHARTARHSTNTSGGEVALPPNPARASADVEQFQRALRDEGCDPGPIDGIIGPSTARAIACARRKGVVPSAPGASSEPSTVLTRDVFSTRTSAVAGEAAEPANAEPAPAARTTVTGIPVPTVNSAHDSTLSGRNSTSDSTLTSTGTANSSRGRVPVVRPDTSHD